MNRVLAGRDSAVATMPIAAEKPLSQHTKGRSQRFTTETQRAAGKADASRLRALVPWWFNAMAPATESDHGMTKIYTGTGDRGKTSLFSGERVTKSDERIEAYGDVDELNSVLGVVAAALPAEGFKLLPEIREIQADLFKIGARLATTTESPAASALPPFPEDPGKQLEAAIDRLDQQLPPLRSFVLPGGHPAAAMAHVARTVCRRAERHTIRLAEVIEPGTGSEAMHYILVYLNRLSDYLFVLARRCNQLAGVEEQRWSP